MKTHSSTHERNRYFFLHEYEGAREYYGSEKFFRFHGQGVENRPDAWSTVPLTMSGNVKSILGLASINERPDLVEDLLVLAEKLRDFVVERDLLNTDARINRNELDQKEFWISTALIETLRHSKNRKPEAWKMAADALVARYARVKDHRTAGPDVLIQAGLFYLAGGYFKEADSVLSEMSKPKKHDILTYTMTKQLAAALVNGGGPVKDPKLVSESQAFFEYISRAGDSRDNSLSVPFNEQFIWALLICAYVYPGDGRWDAQRAIQLFAGGVLDETE